MLFEELIKQKKTVDQMSCYFNKTIPEKYVFNEESEYYSQYENEKISDISLEGLGLLEEEDEEEEINKEKNEKIKEN